MVAFWKNIFLPSSGIIWEKIKAAYLSNTPTNAHI